VCGKQRLVVLAAAIALLAAACGEGGAGAPTEGPSTSGGTEGPAPTVGPTGPPSLPSTVTFQVWFGLGEYLFVTRRTQAATPAVIGRAAMEALLAGPSDAERAAGVGTSIPDGTGLLGLRIANAVATVDLTSDFASGGGSLSMFSRLAQLTYTLTQFPTVRGVNLELDGDPVEVFGAEGIVLDQPMTRRAYRDHLPPILVVSPPIGQEVSSPIRVAGTANVFEASVSISVLDAQGNEIASTTTMATCGTGCRGAYLKAVRYAVGETQPGTVRVFEVSAKDGQPINVVDIPVTLAA
jgi:hypothetical protein